LLRGALSDKGVRSGFRKAGLASQVPQAGRAYPRKGWKEMDGTNTHAGRERHTVRSLKRG
jgi:hypothetical protein